jgi:nucleoside phosphorylase
VCAVKKAARYTAFLSSHLASHLASPLASPPASPGGTKRSGKILVVSAFAPELTPLVRWLRAAGQRAAHRRVTCRPVGIGAVDAAAGAAAALARRPLPAAIVFVGTAGTYGRVPAVEAVAIANRLHLVSGSVATGQAYFPDPMHRRASADGRLRRDLLAAAGGGAVSADVATPIGITIARRVAARLALTSGSTVENLEAFAVARAAAQAHVPFAAILGIANRVGPGAHVEWLKHGPAATAKACAVAAAWIEDWLES